MKKRKIISVFITFAVILFSFSQIAFAAGWTSQVNPNGGAGTSEATKAMNIIIGIFQAVAVGVAAVMLIALAIKYMSSAPGEKAEIKKHAIVSNGSMGGRTGYTWWWLRTTSPDYNNNVYLVKSAGDIEYFCCHNYDIVARPALWIKI